MKRTVCQLNTKSDKSIISIVVTHFGVRYQNVKLQYFSITFCTKLRIMKTILYCGIKTGTKQCPNKLSQDAETRVPKPDHPLGLSGTNDHSNVYGI